MFASNAQNGQASLLPSQSKFFALQWYKLVDNLFPFFNHQIATELGKDNAMIRLHSSINSDGFLYIFNYEILTYLKEFDVYNILKLIRQNIFGHSYRTFFLGLIFF